MKVLIVIFTLVLISGYASAQIDTTSFPKERQEIRELMRRQTPQTPVDCTDFIAVGPKGDISFSHEQWQAVQAKQKLTFKSVQNIPGNEFIRIYDGKMAVVNFAINVNLIVDGKDINLKVRRIEVFRKADGRWCRVAGQGTEVDESVFPVR